MKKTIILIALIPFLFVGCEKERCYECVTSYINSDSQVIEQHEAVVSGVYSAEGAEAILNANTDLHLYEIRNGVQVKLTRFVYCKEQSFK